MSELLNPLHPVLTPRVHVSALAGFDEAGLAALARILRNAKERREQAAIGKAFDDAREAR